MLDIDAMSDFFEEFEDEIKRDYEAFIAGDFDRVDLKGAFPEPKAGEDDEETAEMKREFEKIKDDPEAVKKFLHDQLTDAFLDDDDDEDEDDDEEVEPFKEVTTGGTRWCR
jgi:hypothetical protein